MDHARSAEVDQVIHRRAHGPSCIQNVVKKHDDFVRDIKGYAGVIDRAAGQKRIKVVTVERDIHFTDGNIFAVPLLNNPGEPLRYVRPARAHANKDNLIEISVSLRHLSGETLKNRLDLRSIQNALFLGFVIWLRHQRSEMDG